MAPSAYVSVNSGLTGSTSSIANVIQNDYVIVVVGFEGTAHTVSTVTDSASPATSFSKEASSNTREDIEVWCGQYEATSGSDSITVKTGTAASYSFRAVFAAGLTNCTPDTVKTNSGAQGSPSVGSLTPVTGDFCEAATSDATGSASSTWSIASPFNSQGYYGNSVPVLQARLTSGTGWVADSFKGDWDSSYGATSAAFTTSGGNPLPAWDEVVACFPTYSTGDEMFQGRGFFPRGSSINPNLGVQAPLHNDYIIALIALPVPASTSHVTSVTDGQSDSYTKVVSSGTQADVEMWIARYTGTSGVSIGQLTFNLNLAAAAIIGDFEISGISLSGALSAWASETQIATASGTAGAASVTSFTPDTNDVCIEVSSFNAGVASASWTTPANQPFQQSGSTEQTASGFTNNYFVTAFRAGWPASTSTTATLTPSSTSSPAWDEIVGCFPGSIIVPITCTMSNSAPSATLTLSESSGNGLSPKTVACDGSPHNITVDPSVTLTATEPVAVGSTRYEFAGLATTVTDSTCAGTNSGSCSAWIFTNYYQVQNPYQATPIDPTSWDSAFSIPVTGTSAGTAASTLCVISTSSGGGAASCQGFSDYSTLVTVTSPVAVSSTEQWAESGGNTFTDTTGGNPARNVNYIEQFQVSFRVVPAGQGTTSPSGSNVWMNFGPDAISATQNPGASFLLWTSTGSIAIASAYSASTSATVSGTGTITAQFNTLASDGFVTTDSPVAAVVLARAPSDAIAFSDAATRFVAAIRASADAFSFSDVADRLLSMSRAVGDALSISDALSRALAISRAVQDTFSQMESVVSNSLLSRVGADIFTFTEVPAQALGLNRLVGDSFPISELPVSALTAVSRGLGDIFSFADAAQRDLLQTKAIGDVTPFGEVSGEVLGILRNAADSFSFSDATSRVVRSFVSVADSFIFSDQLGRATRILHTIVVHVNDLFTFSDNAVGQVRLSRSLSDVFTYADSVTRSLSLLQRAVDDFVFNDVGGRLLSIFATVGDSIKAIDQALASSGSAASTSSSGGTPRPGVFTVIFPFLLFLLVLAALVLIALFRRRKRDDDRNGTGVTAP